MPILLFFVLSMRPYASTKKQHENTVRTCRSAVREAKKK